MITTTANVFEEPLAILPFADRLRRAGVRLKRDRMDVVQVNVGLLCNQSCTHCHLEANPHRTEIMDRKTVQLALDFVQATGVKTVDITGGAPELNPHFRSLVKRLAASGCRVMDRSNLTVFFEPAQEDLPNFLADWGVEIIASMPCYTQENVDMQRGKGAYAKSVEAIRRLNALGYGQEGSGLVLNLVYNPLGAFLPAPQRDLEAEYKRELCERSGLCFNRLLTMTNMPLGRFARLLKRSKEYGTYWLTLSVAFNPATLSRLMCRNMVSVSWDGYVYDCDFNQVLGLPLGNGKPFRLGELPAAELAKQLAGREVLTSSYCYACTAGAGSSCGGALA